MVTPISGFFETASYKTIVIRKDLASSLLKTLILSQTLSPLCGYIDLNLNTPT